MTLTEEAIGKINAEMQEDPQNKCLEIMGQYLIDRAGQDQEAAGKIAEKGRTLKKALEKVMEAARKQAVMEAARKQAKDGVAVFGSDEVFGIIDNYFELPSGEKAAAAGQRPGRLQVLNGGKPSGRTVVDVDLDDFL